MLTLSASAASAQTFSPPEGCTLHLTVQERSCSVVQFTRCAHDPPGSWRVFHFGEGGQLNFESMADDEGRWLQATDPETGIVDTLEEPEADPGSLRTLLRDGADRFDFWMRSSDGERLHHVGEDRLTGKVEVIDGETLRQTEFHLTTYAEDGRTLMTREGNQYVSESIGSFFGGPEEAADWTGERQRSDNAPASFARPGESGFATTTPMFDCEMLTAGLGSAVR